MGASAQTPQSSSANTITFRDITQKAGIHFVHNNAAFGKKYLPETMGPGVAFIDYDNDGWPDIFIVNGMDWPGHASKRSTPKLYHNNHDGTFTDVTHKAGLDVEMFGMGVAVGDYDNDGYDDLFVTALGQSRLFHNNGNGTFTDVTQKRDYWGRRNSAPARHGWTTTGTASWTWWWGITCNGRSKVISTARSMARANRIARQSLTRVRPCGSGTIAATAHLKM